MTSRELAIALLAGTALSLSACAQEVGTQEASTREAENYTAAPEGDVSSLIPLGQVFGVHAFFNEPGHEAQIQLPSEYTQYAWQNYSRFQSGSWLDRRALGGTQ